MADKTSNSEKAQEKSLDSPPTSISKTTIIGAAVFGVIIIIGIFMIGKFFLSDPNETQRDANIAEGNVGP